MTRSVAFDVKLTVKALAQNQQGHAVDMKKISAVWAAAYCQPECNDKQNDEPHPEQRSHGFVGR